MKELTSKERLLALEQCELKIATNLKRTQDATVAIGRELYKIKSEKLYEERGYEAWADYITATLPFEPRSTERIIGISLTVDRIKKAGLALPDNESMAAELSRLDAERQTEVWGQILDAQARRSQPLTSRGVRAIVDQIEDAQAKAAAKERTGVKTDLDLDSGDANGEKAAAPATGSGKKRVPDEVTFTEEGEAALERIRRLAGDEAADAIRYLRVPISERDLLKWAEQDDDLVASLAYYLIEQRWSIAKALGFESQAIGPATPFGKVIERAEARGGNLAIDYLDEKVVVQIGLAALA
jgi:hypothetical protein